MGGAQPSGVAEALRGLADRAARWASPAGLAPLVEERVAAGSVRGLREVIATQQPGLVTAADDGWRAMAYGAAGEGAEVERLASAVRKTAEAAPDDRLIASARCGVAAAYEYLGDTDAADRWRKEAKGFSAWCHERLPLIAARAGRHDRAAALLAEETLDVLRLSRLLALAEVYVTTRQPARAIPLLDEAARLIELGNPRLIDPVLQGSKLAVLLAAAGQAGPARAAARRALSALDAQAGADRTMLLLLGEEVAEALHASGEIAALARLLARLEAARKGDERFVARLKNACLVAKHGPRARARALVAAVARDLDEDHHEGAGFAAGFALIDALLALGDLPAAIRQAGQTSVTQPIEVEALIKVARHCRLKGCARTPAVDAALDQFTARLDKLDARLRTRPAAPPP